jgi:hypothetical protein
MIRHASLGVPLAIGLLTTPVCPSAYFRTLITAVGCTPLLQTSFLVACLTAVALATVAIAAHPKQGAAVGSTTESWAEANFGHGRHHFNSSSAIVHRVLR